MNIEIAFTITVTPGSMQTKGEIQADLISRLSNAAFSGGFVYGPVKYTVNGVSNGIVSQVAGTETFKGN